MSARVAEMDGKKYQVDALPLGMADNEKKKAAFRVLSFSIP